MPKNHWVLVAERRGKPSSQRHREIVYATRDKVRADRDAMEMAQSNKRMRYYVMKYNDAVEVAGAELIALEKALEQAKQMIKV